MKFNQDTTTIKQLISRLKGCKVSQSLTNFHSQLYDLAEASLNCITTALFIYEDPLFLCKSPVVIPDSKASLQEGFSGVSWLTRDRPFDTAFQQRLRHLPKGRRGRESRLFKTTVDWNQLQNCRSPVITVDGWQDRQFKNKMQKTKQNFQPLKMICLWDCFFFRRGEYKVSYNLQFSNR